MKELIKEKLEAIAKELGLAPKDFSVEEPPKSQAGDWATNIAMTAGGNPRENAQEIVEKLAQDEIIEKAEIAGPGFINITLKTSVYLEELRKIVEQKDSYGKSSIGNGKKVNVEYISANPTGPLHIGNARSGPIGEAISNLYEFNGYDVAREFYVNDMGMQIDKFGRSLLYWYQKKSQPDLEMFEDGYPAPYIKETSEIIQEKFADQISNLGDNELVGFFAKEGLAIMTEKIKDDLKLAGIEFDKWSYESEIKKSGKSEQVIEKLKQLGFTAEKDGALWFKQPDDPDLMDDESVLVKSSEGKDLTYFTNDIAYHLDKIERGASILVDVWGANHFGHIPRMKAAMRALGQPDALQIILYQYVRLKKSGQVMSMGKRLGNFVTLREVLESGVEPDAFKYYILSQNSDTPIDFDIELAADKSEKNPVYYIKYAHARICSILAKTGEGVVDADLALLSDKKEMALYKELIKFPEVINSIAQDYQIQSLPHYAYKIAKLFHDFYGSCHIVGEEENLKNARISLILATKYVLKNSLNICGIEAPEKM